MLVGMEQWVAQWDVCQVGTEHELPSFFHSTNSMKDHLWWVGLRDILEPLVKECHIHPPTHGVGYQKIEDFNMYKTGGGLPPHPSQAYLHTKCVVPPAGSEFIREASLQGRYKLQPHPGSGQQGQSRAYIKVLRLKFDGKNDREFYLHSILCYMYNGPPADPELVAGHLCGNKMCILPWHLYWITQSDNVKMGWNKKKRRWEY